MAALGLPPLAHEDDPARGVQAALAAQTALESLQWRGAIGVTTGQVFCGSVGAKSRREYTMMGDVVNLAARLMQAAGSLPTNGKGQVSILCDQKTAKMSQIQIEFEKLRPILVKGKQKPVPVYSPTKIKVRLVLEEVNGQRPRAELIGRTKERTAIADRLQALLRGTGSTLIFEGEAGIGKSRLIEDLLRQAKTLSVDYFIGAGNPIEKSTPYHGWRAIVQQLLKLELAADTAEAGLHQHTGHFTQTQRNQVLDQIQELVPELVDLAPLLNAILPLGLPENKRTRQMNGEVRADNIQQLLIGLMQGVVNQSPKVLIIEDAHWLDSASWALLEGVEQAVQPLLLALATRPLNETIPAAYSHLLGQTNSHHLLIDRLPVEDALALVSQRLGVTSLPQPVRALIREKAEGHPFFSEELAYALRDAGVIALVDGRYQLAAGPETLQTLDLPDTLQGVITSRIDRLTPQQQLTLKIASVIGRIFPFQTLQDIHPIEADKAHLPDQLDHLARLDLTPLKSPEPELTYIFKHIITQEVAYNLMTLSQRRQLHQAAAEWHERTYAHDLASVYPLLAHHWRLALDQEAPEPKRIATTIDYLEKAGEQALRHYANQEAIDFFSQAISLDAQLAHNSDRLRQTRWQRQLGAAHYGLGNLLKSRQHLQQALDLLELTTPSSKPKLIAGILGQVGQQGLHRILPGHSGRAEGQRQDKRAYYQEAARIYERLIEAYIYDNQVSAPQLYNFMRGLNLAEAAGPSPELARLYAIAANLGNVLPQQSLTETYLNQALTMSQTLNDLDTRAWVLAITSPYYGNKGRWQQCKAHLEQAIKHLRSNWRPGSLDRYGGWAFLDTFIPRQF